MTYTCIKGYYILKWSPDLYQTFQWKCQKLCGLLRNYPLYSPGSKQAHYIWWQVMQFLQKITFDQVIMTINDHSNISQYNLFHLLPYSPKQSIGPLLPSHTQATFSCYHLSSLPVCPIITQVCRFSCHHSVARTKWDNVVHIWTLRQLHR